MKSKLARIGTVVLALFVSKALWVWAAEGDDVATRRDHLLARTLSATYPDDHQLAPGGIYTSEWQLVTLSMTAATLANMAVTDPTTRADAQRACDTLVERILDPRIRAFEITAWGRDPLEDLNTDNGHIGYLGHLDFLLGACRTVGAAADHHALHRSVSEAIARRMAASPSAHLATYPGRIFTADNSVGVAALAIYDELTGASHANEIARWVEHSQNHLLDPQNGIIVFAVSPEGAPLGRGRGSAAGYNSFYLPFIDEALAAEQFERLREHLLVDLPFGAIGIREYSRGIDTGGDVDTGPLLFGVSPSATGFAIAGARHHQDAALEAGLLRTAEIAGFTAPCRRGRCYLLAPLVGDAIVTAMRTATPWPAR